MNNTRFSSRSAAAVVAIAALVATTRPANAAWHSQADNLPGLQSGKSIAITTSLIGGGVIGGVLLYKRFHHSTPSRVEVPDTLQFSGADEQALVIRNTGAHPVSVSEVTFQGAGFETATTPRTPVLVSAGGSMEIPVRMVNPSGAKARLRVTFIEDGKERSATVNLRGKPAAAVASFVGTVPATALH